MLTGLAVPIPLIVHGPLPTFNVPDGSYVPWLFAEIIQVTKEMVLAVMLDFSSMILPETVLVRNAYWCNFVSVFSTSLFHGHRDSGRRKEDVV